MNSHSIREGDYSQVSPVKFGHRGPESVPIRFLRLRTHGVLDNITASFLLQVRPLTKHLVLEVIGELELGHSAAPDFRDHRTLTPNILHELQTKVARPLLFFLQRE
jgi:hypothetical protein